MDNSIQNTHLALGLLRRLRAEQGAVEALIHVTPTGEARNKLTDVNIHLMSALDSLKAAMEAT